MNTDTSLLQNLAVSSEVWARFDLDSRRPLLDRTATNVKVAREQSQAARKSLSEITKKFKRSVKACENVLATDSLVQSDVKTNVTSLTNQCRTIVKAYQEEIDALTRRSKSSDSAFLNLYQSLYELPDPASILHPLLEYIHRHQEQEESMKNRIEELEIDLKDSNIQNGELKKIIHEMGQETSPDGKTKSIDSNSYNSKSSDNENNEELLNLRKEVAAYEIEFRSLKNQDITIRKLEAKITQLEEKSERELAEALSKAEEKLQETQVRRASEALEREGKMERKLHNLELELRAERAGRNARAVKDFDASEGANEREAAWEAQRQILVDESERLRDLLYDVQRERDDMRLKLDVSIDTNTINNGDNDNILDASDSKMKIGGKEYLAERQAYEAEVSELSLTAATLRDELKVMEDTTREERKKTQDTINRLERECHRLSHRVDTLNEELANSPSAADLEKMKHELRILKRLEYNAEDYDTDLYESMESGKDTETIIGLKSTNDDIESLLVSRLQKMEADLLVEKREKKNSVEKCLSLERKVASLKENESAQNKLIVALEADLNKATAVTPFGSSALQNPSISLVNSDPSTLQSILDPNASKNISTSKSSAKVPTSSISSSNMENAHDDHTVANIVMAQRDRLRARCDALEAERDSFKAELQVQMSFVENLKGDNAKLYEKLRYLQNFPGSKSIQHNDLDLEALEQRYEASVDPFRQFGRAERTRKLKEMTQVERLVFITAKFVLKTKEMRTLLVAYVFCMHFLVFITTYHWAHEGGCQMVSHPALDHMHGGPPVHPSSYSQLSDTH